MAFYLESTDAHEGASIDNNNELALLSHIEVKLSLLSCLMCVYHTTPLLPRSPRSCYLVDSFQINILRQVKAADKGTRA